MAPSDAPSMAPSDSPSGAPSDSPSASPTYAPSAAPFTWNDVLGNDSIDYKTCPLDPIPVNFTSTTELTVLYSYILELQPNSHVFKTLEKIEGLLQTKLTDQVCSTISDTLGVSSSPSDIPGGTFHEISNEIDVNLTLSNVCLWCRFTKSATCGPNTDKVGDGPCFIISGRFKLLIDINSIGDASSNYCEFLEISREYITSGDILAQIPEVASISSTIAGSLVPSFCTYKISKVSASENDSESTSTGSAMSISRIIPIVLGIVTIVVALASVLIIIKKYRTASIGTQQLVDNPSSAESDLEFQHSDESDDDENNGIVPENSNVETDHQNKGNAQKTHASSQIQNEQEVTYSPTHTEQEIIFTPSSSVATSVLFRSP
jgi:hypothetical protein